MNVQYISDESGQYTAVIIPISDWNSINIRLDNVEKKNLSPTNLPILEDVFQKRQPMV